jgi:hypothetical protein
MNRNNCQPPLVEGSNSHFDNSLKGNANPPVEMTNLPVKSWNSPVKISYQPVKLSV